MEERLQALLDASSQLSFVERYILNPLRRMYSVVSQFPRHYHSSCGALISSIHHQLSSISLAISLSIIKLHKAIDLPDQEKFWFLYLPIYLLISVVFAIYTLAESLLDIANSAKIKHNAPYVPTFYAPSVLTADSGTLYFIVLPIVATIFGALHLIAWQFHFQSHIEQLLWRIGSLAITIIPATPLVFMVLIFFSFFFLKFLEKIFGFCLPKFSILLPGKLENFLMWVLLGARCKPRSIYARSHYIINPGCRIVEEATRQRLLCNQLVPLFAPHMNRIYVKYLSNVHSLYFQSSSHTQLLGVDVPTSNPPPVLIVCPPFHNFGELRPE